MKKRFILTIVAAMLLTLLAGCGCSHEWTEASCETPKTCSLCGETEGEALGHSFGPATCAAPSTCANCGATEGEALEHSFGAATCAAPSTCANCGATEGEALPHELTEANFQKPSVCTVCGAEVGEPVISGFERLGIQAHYAKLGEPVTITAKGAKYSVEVFSYEVYESDETHEAMDGYVWHAVKVMVTALEDQSTMRTSLPTYSDLTDYYDPERMNAELTYVESDAMLSLEFPVNYLGEDYTDCLFREEKSEVNFTDGVATYEENMYIRLPAGYDGVMTCIGDGELVMDDYMAHWQEFYNSENTVFFRLDGTV